jgi:aspartyl-tRNA(Asn)/glutamyl-tRNA(Gln) amidotransferase subunit B
VSAVATAWEPVIGLEIHVQLSTDSKMFCRCANRFGAEPNTLTCPVCLGQPGALPTINAGAVDRAIQIGLALNCEIASSCLFHRKNYFYPDSPKAYQISQYDEPICAHGWLEVDGGRIGITRAHLEEDAAKLVHAGGTGGRIAGADYSLVDFNRCGTPLVEIVTEPDIRSPEQAIAFLGLLRTTLQTIGVSDCDMEKGSLRCDANVSVRPEGSAAFGTKTELKNMNSFKFLGDGMAAEIRRQIDLLESGGEVRQETLHYDPASRTLHARRSKEEADDYRYFPEPDLVPLAPSRETVERLRAAMPELPAARIARFREAYGLSAQDATDLNASPRVADYFERVAELAGDGKAAADWVRNQPSSVEAVPAEGLAGLVRLIEAGTITPTIAKQVYTLLEAEPDADPGELVARHGLGSIGDSDELATMVDEVIAANPRFVEQFLAGKDGVINAMVGQVMKQTRGRADARQVQELFRDRLAGQRTE